MLNVCAFVKLSSINAHERSSRLLLASCGVGCTGGALTRASCFCGSQTPNQPLQAAVFSLITNSLSSIASTARLLKPRPAAGWLGQTPEVKVNAPVPPIPSALAPKCKSLITDSSSFRQAKPRTESRSRQGSEVATHPPSCKVVEEAGGCRAACVVTAGTAALEDSQPSRRQVAVNHRYQETATSSRAPPRHKRNRCEDPGLVWAKGNQSERR